MCDLLSQEKCDLTSTQVASSTHQQFRSDVGTVLFLKYFHTILPHFSLSFEIRFLTLGSVSFTGACPSFPSSYFQRQSLRLSRLPPTPSQVQKACPAP